MRPKDYPYGECRNSPENFPTDRLFTGQRLDDTGLYFYNARYYDATTGRFVSPDIFVPESRNPQSFNRYSYCINNPSSTVDPTGRDYIFVCGSGGKASDWDAMINGLDISPTEKIIILTEAEATSGIKDGGFEVRDQEWGLTWTLQNIELTDIKIIGHSEGAAATINVLDRLTRDPDYLAGINVRNELTAAVMLDAPTGISDLFVDDWDDVAYNGLPARMNQAGMGDVKLLDVWNTASIVHSTGVMPGWNQYNTYSYTSAPGLEGSSLFGFMTRLINVGLFHGNPRYNPAVISMINAVID
jgi:RHS repeat-associated protein